MEKIKSTTKQGQRLIKMYENSRDYSVKECYNKPSNTKNAIEYRLKVQMRYENGYDYRILSYNTFHFTCGWKTAHSTYRIETPTRTIEII